jgi:hypothetical protein
MTISIPSFVVSLLVCLAGFLLTPVSALAADTFVDQAAGNDANSCLGPGAQACQRIVPAVNKAGPGDTIHVADPAAPTTYAESVSLAQGRSLVAESSDPAETIIGTLATPVALTVQASGAGTVEGFTIRAGQQPAWLHGPAVLDGNVFDQSTPPTGSNNADIRIEAGAGAAEVTDNTFTDAVQDGQAAILTSATGSPLIAGNTISGFNVGIFAFAGSGGTPRIVDNDVSGTHAVGSAGVGILVRNQEAQVSRNFVHGAAAGITRGISIVEFTGVAETGAELSGNRVIGHQIGVGVTDTDGAVTLDSDVVAKSTVDGLNATDQLAAGGGDVTATNVTLYDSAVDVHVSSAHLELDSSIVESPIADSFSATCNITFSRGPTTGGSACQSFQTVADPTFVNPGADDYHLQAGSPMIDAGNTPPPPDGAVDLDGDPRVLDGNNSCPDRRDIGADEFLLAPANPCAPDTAIVGGPSGTTGDSSPTFEFAANEPGASFECRTDGDAFGACSGPGATHTSAPLPDGAHTFEVRATDAGALADPTPALASFTVDTSSPPPPPPPPGPDPEPDPAPEPGPEPDPILEPVPDAKDATAPETTIAKRPLNALARTTARYRFASDEAGSRFECKFDRKPFRACTSPKRYRRLDQGKHVFRVRAVDAAGNVDASAAQDSFRILG